jgi:hypothetical protein
LQKAPNFPPFIALHQQEPLIMKKRTTIIFGLLLCCCIAGTAAGQEPLKPWEKYGISRTEWKMTLDNKISEEKLKVILSSGVSITEYCQKPWKKLNIKEAEWMDKRRAGMSSYDIELDAQSDRTGYKQDNKKMMKVDTTSVSVKQTPGLFTSFILPGYQQGKIGHKTRGAVMAGLAYTMIAGSFVLSVHEGGFEPIPLLIIIPDMFWSLLDYKTAMTKKSPE